ncbi:MAG: hypothetical protein RLZZ08_282 [Pseudomonadota bacterium]
MGKFARIAGAMLGLLPTLAAAAEPVKLEPTTDWIVDYAPERCSLTRGFGEGKHALRLQIDSFGNPEYFRVLLVGPVVPPNIGPVSKIRLRMTPESKIREPIDAFRGKADQLDAASFALTFPKKASNLQVHFSPWNAIDINTQGMTGPLTALRTCTHDLWASWGLDPVREEKLSRRVHLVAGTPQPLSVNYPVSMLLTGQTALIPVRIMVGTDGKATDCVLQSTLVKPQFKAAVCTGLPKDYDPALDAYGKPVPSVIYMTVFFI